MTSPHRCSFVDCVEPAVEIHDLPYPVCDQHFAYMGFRRIKPVPQWKRMLRTVGPFLRIVGRRFDSAGGRLGVGLAWEVARGVHD